MMKILTELGDWGIGNIIWTFLLTLFFYLLAYKIDLSLDLFGIIYAYITCVCIGHYLIHNAKPGYKSKFENNKVDTFVLIPIVGAITFIFWGGSIWTLNLYFDFLAILVNII